MAKLVGCMKSLSLVVAVAFIALLAGPGFAEEIKLTTIMAGGGYWTLDEANDYLYTSDSAAPTWKVGIGNKTPGYSLETAAGGSISVNDGSLRNVRALYLKDWDDNTGGSDNKYRLLARDGAWQFYNGGVVVGGYNNGTWTDVPDGRLIVKSDVGIGTTAPGSRLEVKGAGSTRTSKALKITNSIGRSLFSVNNRGGVELYPTLDSLAGSLYNRNLPGLQVHGWFQLREADTSPIHYRNFAIDNNANTMYIMLPDGKFTSMTSANKWTSAGWGIGSDISLKKDISNIGYGLDAVLRMQPRKFNFKSSDAEGIGFVAQEIEKVVPEVVSGKDGEKSIDYGPLTAVLVRAIQEQQGEIGELRQQNEELRQRIARLEKK